METTDGGREPELMSCEKHSSDSPCWRCYVEEQREANALGARKLPSRETLILSGDSVDGFLSAHGRGPITLSEDPRTEKMIGEQDVYAMLRDPVRPNRVLMCWLHPSGPDSKLRLQSWVTKLSTLRRALERWGEELPVPKPPRQLGLDLEPEGIPVVPRTFRLMRRRDVTGVSGTGHVADGVLFEDGTVVVRWRGEAPTTTVHESLQSVERIHLHEGATELRWDL